MNKRFNQTIATPGWNAAAWRNEKHVCDLSDAYSVLTAAV